MRLKMKTFYGRNIEESIALGLVVLQFSHGENENHGIAIVCNTQEQVAKENIDTRGECHSMWSERWSRIVSDVSELKRITRVIYDDHHKFDFFNDDFADNFIVSSTV